MTFYTLNSKMEPFIPPMIIMQIKWANSWNALKTLTAHSRCSVVVTYYQFKLESLEIFSGIRCEVNFWFVLSQLSQHNLFNNYILASSKKPCGWNVISVWPQSSRGNSLYRATSSGWGCCELPAHLSLRTLPQQSQGFLRMGHMERSLAAACFPAPFRPQSLSPPQALPALWPVRPAGPLSFLTTLLPQPWKCSAKVTRCPQQDSLTGGSQRNNRLLFLPWMVVRGWRALCPQGREVGGVIQPGLLATDGFPIQ